MLSVWDSCEFRWEDNDSIFIQLLISVVMTLVLFLERVDEVCVCIYARCVYIYKCQRYFILKLVYLLEQQDTVLGDATFSLNNVFS